VPAVDRDSVIAALPDYTVGRELGAGGFGLVLSGYHRPLDRDVAIKVLSRRPRGATEELRGEGRLLSRLDHPHIAVVHDFVSRGDIHLLVMELLGTRYYRDAAAVRTHVEKISAERGVRAWLRTHIDTDPGTGRPLLVWHFDEGALETAEKADGWFALLTNLTVEKASAAEIFVKYKGQEAVERRHSAFKGLLAVAPTFLENTQRLHGLLHVVCLALLLFSLIEREARRNAGPDGKVSGLYARRPARPTGRLILEALADTRLVPAHNSQPAYIPRPTPLQQRVLDLLGVDPTKPP